MKKLISIFCICVLFSACREDTPMTGTLQVSITLDTTDPSTAYALFTEGIYLSGQYLPLRQGAASRQDLLEFKELLPGTYIFVLYTATPKSFTGQVVSGKQSQLNVVP